MEYEKKVKQRFMLSVLFFLIGISAFSIGMYLKLDAGRNTFTAGYLYSTGGGLTIVGAVMAIQKLMLLKDRILISSFFHNEQMELWLFCSHY